MIGLFGGAFDPIHFGHLRPVLEVKQRLGLEQIRFIPVNQPPHKNQPILPAKKRAQMVARAIELQPGFELDECELQRGGVTYSVDTLRAMRQHYGEQQALFFLMGTDAFAGLPKWHRWKEVLKLAHIVIMLRPESQIDVAKFPAGYLQSRMTGDSEHLLAKAKEAACGKIIRLNVTQLDISSSKIREILRQGQSVRYLMPEAEANFLYENKFYS